jgi:hypothetical protein
VILPRPIRRTANLDEQLGATRSMIGSSSVNGRHPVGEAEAVDSAP